MDYLRTGLSLKLFCGMSLLLILLTGCASTKFLNQPVSAHDSLCSADQPQCYWQLRKNKGLLGYDIQIDPDSNEVQVKAKAVYEDHRIGNQWLEYYILFFDEHRVIYEKKVKVRGSESSHSFEFTPSSPVKASTIADVRMWVAS